MEDTGRILLAYELRGTHTYWQVTDATKKYFPPDIVENGAVSLLFDDSYQYTNDFPCQPNCFPAKHACATAINAMPFTTLSPRVIRPEWVKVFANQLFNHLLKELEYSCCCSVSKYQHLGFTKFIFAVTIVSLQLTVPTLQSTLVVYVPANSNPGALKICKYCCGVNQCPPANYTQNNCTCCKGNIPAVTKIWGGYVHMMMSILGGDYNTKAWIFAQTLKPQNFDSGNSMTSTLFWIAAYT